MKKKTNIIKKLQQFFSEITTSGPTDRFNRWFNSFDDSSGYLNSLNSRQKQQHKNKLFRQLEDELGWQHNSPDKLPVKPLHTRTFDKYKIFKVAAVLVAGALLSVALYYTVSEDITTRPAVVQKINGTGEISEFVLPDSSKVWLSAASTLKFPKIFDEQSRTVYLDGEAFFEVTSDSARPFVVHAGAVKTRVLGTSFNIKAYTGGEDPDIKVTLATGRIEVTSENNSLKAVLEPGQQIIYNKKNGWGTIREVQPSLETVWTKRELVFVRESFASIARTFERWYGVEFIFEDASLKEEVFVYHFKELFLEKSLRILSKMADFSYKIEKNQVILSAE